MVSQDGGNISRHHLLVQQCPKARREEVVDSSMSFQGVPFSQKPLGGLHLLILLGDIKYLFPNHFLTWRLELL